MADGFIRVPPDSTGKLIDTSEITVGANTVERHRVNITDPISATAMAPVTSSGGLGVTILAGAASGSTAVNIVGSSGAIAPATSSGGQLVTVSAGTITLSSAIAISSGIITLSSAPLVIVATSGGTIPVALSTVFSLSSVPTVTATAATNPWSSAPSFNLPIISASSGQMGVYASTSRQYLSFVFNSSSSNSFTTVTTLPAVLYGWNVGNQGTSASASIKIFNTTSGVVGSTAQLQVTIPIPGGSAGAGNNFILPQGVSCTGGISYLITANFAATSTGPVAAGDVVGSLYYNT